jgi:hypothetical protein
VSLGKPVFMELKNRFWKTSYRKRSVCAPLKLKMLVNIGKYW